MVDLLMGETSSIFRSSTFAGWVSKLNLLGRPGQALHAIVCRSSTCLLQTGNVARTLKNCWEFSSACAITGKLILQAEWSRSSEKKAKRKKERGGTERERRQRQLGVVAVAGRV